MSLSIIITNIGYDKWIYTLNVVDVEGLILLRICFGGCGEVDGTDGNVTRPHWLRGSVVASCVLPLIPTIFELPLLQFNDNLVFEPLLFDPLHPFRPKLLSILYVYNMHIVVCTVLNIMWWEWLWPGDVYIALTNICLLILRFNRRRWPTELM